MNQKKSNINVYNILIQKVKTYSLKQRYSHNGTKRNTSKTYKLQHINNLESTSGIGILYDNCLIPNFKRKIEMTNFEDKANYNLLFVTIRVIIKKIHANLNKIESLFLNIFIQASPETIYMEKSPSFNFIKNKSYE